MKSSQPSTQSDQVRAGQLATIARGFLPAGRPPFGYRTEQVAGEAGRAVRVLPDPTIAPQIHQAFELRLAGLSYLEIGARVGLALSRKAWSSLLRNPAYKGVYTFGVAQYEGVIPAIVDAQLWAQVQTTLRAAPVRAWVNRSPYLLNGLLKCRNHHTMSGNEFATDGRRYRHYRCSRRLQRGKAACDAPSVPCEQIENAVLAQVRAALATPETVAVVLAALRAQYQVDQLVVELAAVERTVRDAEAAIRRLVELVDLGGEVTLEVRRHLSERQQELATAQARRVELTTQAPWLPDWDEPTISARLLELGQQCAVENSRTQRAALRNLLERITWVDGQAFLHWRLPGPVA